MQSWSWSYGSWICDYLCIVSSNPTQVRCTGYTILWDKVCQWLVAGRWFSPGTLDSSTNSHKSNYHTITTTTAFYYPLANEVAKGYSNATFRDKNDITEILLKVLLNTITLTLKLNENYKKKSLYLFLLLMLKFS
jgi:hypothetical protein